MSVENHIGEAFEALRRLSGKSQDEWRTVITPSGKKRPSKSTYIKWGTGVLSPNVAYIERVVSLGANRDFFYDNSSAMLQDGKSYADWVDTIDHELGVPEIGVSFPT
jgi:hypothetical protein